VLSRAQHNSATPRPVYLAALTTRIYMTIHVNTPAEHRSIGGRYGTKIKWTAIALLIVN
jgi:hypothetical protein